MTIPWFFDISLLYLLYKPLEIINIIDELPNKGGLRYAVRRRSEIKQLCGHHTAHPSQDPQDINDMHHRRDWPRASYAFLIDKNTGKIYQINPIEAIGNTVKNQNTKTLSWAWMANYSEEEPRLEAIIAAYKLVKHLRKELGWNVPIKKHSDLRATECCGTKFPWTSFVKICNGASTSEDYKVLS